jgi:hypothetical protein
MRRLSAMMLVLQNEENKMSIHHRFSFYAVHCSGLILIACGSLVAPAQPAQINGQPVVVLKRAATSNGTKPEFLTATILPGRGSYRCSCNAFVG